MPKRSAGILLYRHTPAELEVFLVHPGGPFWAKKDAGAWGIPKGECQPGETTLAAARREFAEETGFRPEGHFVELGSFPSIECQNGRRLGACRRCRSGQAPEQHVPAGVAAEVRADAGIP